MQPFDLEPTQPLDGDAVLPLDQARAHLRVLDCDEDGVIIALRDSAIEWVEQYCARALAAREWHYVADYFPQWSGDRYGERVKRASIRLPMGPTEIVSVRYLDQDGVFVTMPPGDYHFGRELLSPGLNKCWPATANLPGAVEVTYRAEQSVPTALVQAVKLLMGHFFVNRGESDGDVPPAVTALCAPYKIWHV